MEGCSEVLEEADEPVQNQFLAGLDALLEHMILSSYSHKTERTELVYRANCWKNDLTATRTPIQLHFWVSNRAMQQ